MKNDRNYEKGHTNPMMTLAIIAIMGIIAYLGFDSMNPDDPASTSLSDMLTTWLGWSWWAKGLSIFAPVALILVGSKLDSSSGFSKLPPDE